MTVVKRFSFDKPDTAPVPLTRLQAIVDFFVFIGLSTAYIIQVSFVNFLEFYA